MYSAMLCSAVLAMFAGRWLLTCSAVRTAATSSDITRKSDPDRRRGSSADSQEGRISLLGYAYM